MTWVPVSLLANLALPDEVFAGPIGLAAADHSIVAEIRRGSPNFDGFVSRFKDEFGHGRGVSVLLRDSSRHNGFTSEAIAGFRDAVALSVVLFTRAKYLDANHSPTCLWTDYFDIYPWRVANDHDFALCSSPVLCGFHETSAITGAVTPGVPQPNFSNGIWYFDAPLRQVLLDRWIGHFIDGQVTHECRALFRSLNMAYAAARAPAGTELGIYDVGRTLSLWISALEILFHSGKERIHQRAVIQQFNEFSWQSEKLSHRCYEITVGRAKITLQVNWPSQLVKRLYDIRNQFIHGDTIQEDLLNASDRRAVPMHSLAFPLYRMALTMALQIPSVSPGSRLQFGQQLRPEDEWLIRGGWYERALLSPFEPTDED